MPKTTLLAVVGHVQWSGVCILVIAHLCVSSYVRWASNGNMKQPRGVLVAGHFASEKNTTFFVFARTLHAPSESFFPAQETTIEHMLASERLSEHSGAWVKRNYPSLSRCATIGSILPIAFLGGQNGHMFMNSRRYNARLLE